jgi:hypothetical protein
MIGIGTPCSVKTQGSFRCPPRPVFDIAIYDIKNLNSSRVSWKAKSGETCLCSHEGNHSIGWPRSHSLKSFLSLWIAFHRISCIAAPGAIIKCTEKYAALLGPQSDRVCA